MTSSYSCPACASSFAVNIKIDSLIYRQCKQCKSIAPVTAPQLDYTFHTASVLALRDYVELNCAIDHITASVLQLLQDRPLTRYLDIGAGYGFACDIATRLLGHQAYGIEPSSYGHEGAHALGATISPDYLDENHPIAKERFGAITAFQVLEHCLSPRTDLVLWRSLLEPGGTLLVEVPSAEALLRKNLTYSERLAILDPGSHAVIFSKLGLQYALKAAGFSHINITTHGSNLEARAADSPIPQHVAVNAVDAGIRYLTALLPHARDPILRRGVVYRLFSLLVSSGFYAEASEHLTELLSTLHLPRLGCTVIFDDYAHLHPFYSGPAFYFIGMYYLNYTRDYPSSLLAFSYSEYFCRAKIAVAPGSAVVEASILPLATRHQDITRHIIINDSHGVIASLRASISLNLRIILRQFRRSRQSR